MQLKIQRSQRPGGVLANKVIFCLDVRAQYTEIEKLNINKYRLGGENVYSSRTQQRHHANVQSHTSRVGRGDSLDGAAGLGRGLVSLALARMSLSISVASLGRGHHIECKDLSELVEAEDALREACRNLKTYLSVASSFSGSIVLVDFDDGEKEHVSEGVLAIDGGLVSTDLGVRRATEGVARAGNSHGFPSLADFLGELAFSSVGEFLQSMGKAARKQPEVVMIGGIALSFAVVILLFYWSG